MESLLNMESSQINLGTCKYRLQKFYLSYYIQAVYIILIILSLISLIWVLLHQKYHQKEWIIILEVFICLAILIDLMLRIYLTGFCLFIRSFINIVDIILTIFCAVEIFIALIDVIIKDIATMVTLLILILRNCLMILRVFILMKRTFSSRKRKEVDLGNVEGIQEKSLDEILEGNRDYIKVVYRARLDTLGEADEIFEDSLNQKHSVWEGRVKATTHIEE